MYARVAHFEGGTPEVIERQVELLHADVAAAREGTSSNPSTLALSGVIDRVVMLVDRENAAATTIVFCDSREDLLEADRILRGMSAPGDIGARTSVDMYEVAVDDSPRAQKKAA
jgi:hypothetical protein